MSNCVFLINSQLLNLFLDRYFNQNPGSFAGSETESDLDIQFDYAVKTQPVFSLSDDINLPDPVTPNTPSFSVKFPQVPVNLYDYENGKRGDLLESSVFCITFSGVFALSNNTMSVADLTARVTGTANVKLMNYVVNNKVVPALQNLLSGLTYPQVFNILGKNITLQPAGIFKCGDNLEADVIVDGGGGETALGLGDASPQFAVGLNSDALQRIVNGMGGFPLSKSYSKSDSVLGWGYEADFTVKINTPRVSLRDNQMAANLTINPSLDLKVKNWIKHFHHSVGLPDVNATLGAKVVSQGNKVLLMLELASLNFNFPSDWPWPFSKIEDAVMKWIEDAVKLGVESTIKDALFKVCTTLFTLPASIPGTVIQAQLSINKLGVDSSSLVGVIDVS